MFSYTAYGIGIKSELPLPELVPAKAAADLVIRLNSLETERARYGTKSHAVDQEAYLFWDVAGACRVRYGNEIVFDPIDGLDEATIRLLVLGPAIGMALLQRGLRVLHGSTVDVNGSAVVFLGHSGAGKSTLAATFCNLGHKMITDDVTPIEEMKSGELVVRPGFPQMKLLPDAITSFGRDPEVLPLLSPLIEKRAYRFEREFQETPVPLRRIYALADGDAPTITPLGQREGFIELIRHSYRPAGMSDTNNPTHFRQCTDLINRVGVSRLERPRSLASLADVVKLVEDDLRN